MFLDENKYISSSKCTMYDTYIMVGGGNTTITCIWNWIEEA